MRSGQQEAGVPWNTEPFFGASLNLPFPEDQEAVTGQVIGGRWKPLHHWLEQNLFTDVFVACGDLQSNLQILCVIKNDGITPFSGSVRISAIRYDGTAHEPLYAQHVSLAAGPAVTMWITCQLPSGTTPNNTVVFTMAYGDDGSYGTRSVDILAPPKYLQLLPLTVNATVLTENPDGTILINVTSSGKMFEIALYVTLTTLAQGRFYPNSFIMVAPVMMVVFTPFLPNQARVLANTLRVEHVAGYQGQGALSRVRRSL